MLIGRVRSLPRRKGDSSQRSLPRAAAPAPLSFAVRKRIRFRRPAHRQGRPRYFEPAQTFSGGIVEGAVRQDPEHEQGSALCGVRCWHSDPDVAEGASSASRSKCAGFSLADVNFSFGGQAGHLAGDAGLPAQLAKRHQLAPGKAFPNLWRVYVDGDAHSGLPFPL